MNRMLMVFAQAKRCELKCMTSFLSCVYRSHEQTRDIFPDNIVRLASTMIDCSEGGRRIFSIIGDIPNSS